MCLLGVLNRPLFAVTIWLLWRWRNALVFNGDWSVPLDLWPSTKKGALKFPSHPFKLSNEVGNPKQREKVLLIWQPLLEG